MPATEMPATEMPESEGKSAGPMKTEIVAATEAPVPVDAATVVVIRNALTKDAQAVGDTEVLMLKRNARGVFGGMWVFPGGQVDQADREDAPAEDVTAGCEPPHGPENPAPDQAGAGQAESGQPAPGQPGPDYRGFRTAAKREAAEEAGIDLSGAELVHLSHWLPPPIRPKRFATHFFVCEAPMQLGEIAVDQTEILDHAWVTPAEALRRRAAGEIEFVTPTFVTLTYLAKFNSATAAIEATTQARARCFHTEMIQSPPHNPGMVAVYPGDAAYPAGDLDASGPRRRCYMLESGWSWEEHS